MKPLRPRKGWSGRKAGRGSDLRLDILRYALCAIAGILILRLFFLMVLQHGFYEALASGQRELYEELLPSRGEIYVRDGLRGETLTVAQNRRLAFVWADPRLVKDPEASAKALAEVFGYDEARQETLRARLSKRDDPYEPIERNVDEETLQGVIALGISGVSFVREEARAYPEPGLGGHLLGFLGSDADGRISGKYGAEGHFDAILSGTKGSLRSERDIRGRLISVGERLFEPAVDGSDLVLTIDRSVQYFACRALRNAVLRHRADGGSVVVLDPNTGGVLAMCGYPDFDPNAYAQAASVSVFNNPAIFNDYEPGSIFKPITIAAGIDAGAITPATGYEDKGEEKIDEYTIRNSDKAAHGWQTMTQALEKSLNTGMIFAMRSMGQDAFARYVRAFGFGEGTGIELDTEATGTVRSLDIGHEIYAATASFGQGITVTPLQMAAAYGAIANGGILKRPTVVAEIRRPDGTVEVPVREDVRRAIDQKTSRLVGAMLIAVVEHGHGGKAGVPGYWVAGKTGTAQVPSRDGTGYLKDVTIGSFAGFAPADDPRFVIVTRIDRPRDVPWAESTAAPLFGEIAAFLLKYLEIPPNRL